MPERAETPLPTGPVASQSEAVPSEEKRAARRQPGRRMLHNPELIFQAPSTFTSFIRASSAWLNHFSPLGVASA